MQTQDFSLNMVFRFSFLLILAVFPLRVSGQFLDSFDSFVLLDQQGQHGWSGFTGDGNALIMLAPGSGVLRVQVDATGDMEGIWWAILKRNIAEFIDLQKVSDPEYELRVEARIRTSHAPRRVNLSLNTQRTTDFHDDLMEFDIPDTEGFHTIGFTTHQFDGKPGDQLNVQLALMDWGLEKYEVQVDYLRVDVVSRKHPIPDAGTALPYHPEVAGITEFSHHVKVSHDATIDLRYPDHNFNDWYAGEPSGKAEIIAVGHQQYVLLRWDLDRYKGRKIKGSGLLSLTTQSIQRAAAYSKDFGMIHVSEITGGDPDWDQKTVTYASFLQGHSQNSAINTQMIIDNTLNETPGQITCITLSEPVLQRLLDGKTGGIALLPLGAVQAALYSVEFSGGDHAATLHFNLK